MRAAIVGSGYIARVHARLIAELGGEVVAVCGRTLAGAQALGIGQAYDNLDAMLRAEKPDVVHVCSPNSFHAEQTIASFAAGAHVLCEKPMATSADDCRRMIDAADAAGRVGAIAYCYRGYPIIRELRRLVRNGDFGALWRITGLYLSQDVCDPDKYVWHFSPGLCGPAFALFDYGVHWFDLLQFVTGQPIAEIQAQFSTRRPDRTWRGRPGEGPRPQGEATGDGGVRVDFALEDQADLLVRLAGGASGSATVMALSPGNPNHIALSVDGESGGFDWLQEQPNSFVERRPGLKIIRDRDPDRLDPADRWTAAVPGGHPEGYPDAFRNVIAESWRGMRGETADFPTFGAGLRGIAIVEAAVASAAERRPVAVDLPGADFARDYPMA
ncbi:Gfo/Idh/MocA family protein [Bauldia litoralis]|uniref:Gfo/Idh/MocA family protein n=1 Tax=Bauldia litoralis TaxID=665467 RepID=UPI003263F883